MAAREGRKARAPNGRVYVPRPNGGARAEWREPP